MTSLGHGILLPPAMLYFSLGQELLSLTYLSLMGPMLPFILLLREGGLGDKRWTET